MKTPSDLFQQSRRNKGFVKSLSSKFCIYIYINHPKGVWKSVFIVWYESPFCQNLDGRDFWYALQKSLFIRDYWTKSDWVLAMMLIIICRPSFIILKHIQINLQFRKLLMLKVRLSFVILGGQSVYTAESFHCLMSVRYFLFLNSM